MKNIKIYLWFGVKCRPTMELSHLQKIKTKQNIPPQNKQAQTKTKAKNNN